MWVAGGAGGTLRTSTDAVTWVTQTSQFTLSINSIAYGNNTWVAGGTSGALRTSTDAITWVTQTSNYGTSDIQSAAYGNGTWVAVGEGGALRTADINSILYTIPNIPSPVGYTSWFKT